MANATIRVQFGNPDGSGSDGHLSAEVDTRPDGLNGGRSSFSPGETAYILVYKSDNVSITDTICSAGSLSAQGSAVVTVTEELMFEDADTPGDHLLVHGALLRGQDSGFRCCRHRWCWLGHGDPARLDGGRSGAVGRGVELLVPGARV